MGGNLGGGGQSSIMSHFKMLNGNWWAETRKIEIRKYGLSSPDHL